MRASSLRYILPEPFISLKRNFLMTLAAVLTVVIALFLCGIFGLLVVNINENATLMEQSVEVKAFLVDGLTEDHINALSAEIRAMDGVAEVDYITKTEGLEVVANRFGDPDEILAAIKTNPLPNAYTIKATDTESVGRIATTLSTYEEFEAVRYGEDSVEKLFLLMHWLRIGGIAIMVLLGLSAVVLISMNIRLSVTARREEIQVMKLVGATNSFITWPFILEGILLGILGGIIAVVLVLLSYNAILSFLSGILSFVTFVSLWSILPITIGGIILFSIILGAIGSMLAVRKHVRI